MKRKNYFICFLIFFMLSACTGGWTTLTLIDGGKVVDVGKYEIIVPSGDGWSYKTNMSQGVIELGKNENGKITLISVAKGWISDELAKESSGYISRAILAEEERILRERGRTRNYNIMDGKSWAKFVTHGGKQFHAWGYTVSDWNNFIEKHIVYVMYIYIPPNYKVEKNYYAFLIAEPSAIGFKLYDVDLTIIESVLDSFNVKK